MIFAMLCYYVANLTDANPMLAGDGAIVGKRASNQPVLHLKHFGLLFWLVRDAAMEVAVCNVRADDASESCLFKGLCHARSGAV